MNIKRRCNRVGCRTLINHNETYCREHKGNKNREYNKFRRETDREYVDFYSSKSWRDIRYQRLLRDSFLCQRCYRDLGVLTQAEVIHHMYNRRQYPEHELDIETLISLCWKCHEQIEASKDPRYVWDKQ